VAVAEALWRKLLITEYASGATERLSGARGSRKRKNYLCDGSAANADLAGARRWEEAKGNGEPTFVPRQRGDLACIVYSSGTGGSPRLHDDARKLPGTVHVMTHGIRSGRACVT